MSADVQLRGDLLLGGVIQGIGLRPFLYRVARELDLKGWVRNEGSQVRVRLAGDAGRIERFRRRLHHEGPPALVLDREVWEALPAAEERPFRITPSSAASRLRPALPADLAPCADCRRELADPTDRRYRYPFINCTNCGPRWSIISGLPYDRPLTSMEGFRLCPVCRAEYGDPADRRFHAQPVACPECGPQLRLLSAKGEVLARREEALQAGVDLLRRGRILALKGVGGYQLLVDAERDAAVRRLRQRKHRPHKALALLVRDMEMARSLCGIDALEEELLAGSAAPIVLLAARRRNGIARAVAPDTGRLGLMLPASPLHLLLAEDFGEPLVCTSGNRSEEPMACEAAEALQGLEGIADGWLDHDRPILRAVDDSVMQVLAPGTPRRQAQLIRRARGHAPRSLPLPAGPCALALGAHLKNTLALGLEEQAVLSSHVGDLDSRPARDLCRRTAQDLLSFFRAEPELFLCDAHPDYASTRLAEELAAGAGRPLRRLQHHRAHAGALLAEHAVPRALVFAWDGAGFGGPAEIQGGEAFLWEDGRLRRVARLRPFGLPGGDRAARDPRRCALALLAQCEGPLPRDPSRDWYDPAARSLLQRMLDGGPRTPDCSSVGRLFDGVAALAGVMQEIQSHEGQAAVRLEHAAGGRVTQDWPILWEEKGELLELDWRPWIARILEDGADPAALARSFHGALARSLRGLAHRLGQPTVGLCGGCFQNALLCRAALEQLDEAGIRTLLPQALPAGDGAIALGQLWLARVLDEDG